MLDRASPPLLALLLLLLSTGIARAQSLDGDIDRRAAELREQVIEWRRDLHAHPELGNRERRTAGIVAEHLRSIGLDEVRTEIAHTGVVAVLRGALPGSVVALRADMDALPVTEQTGLPFASEVRTEYNGQEVGVMHACGHDVHTSVLMGAASVLASIRDRLAGTVVFIFQPAEEGPPPGEEGGAKLMIEEGVLRDPRPQAIFALHAWPITVGMIGYRAGGAMASADDLRIVVEGSQTHGAQPWKGVDPIVTASQIVLGLQTVVSRSVAPTTSPAVVSIGSIHGGVRHNIIPDRVEMLGTVRNLNPEAREVVWRRIDEIATNIAESAGARATVELSESAPVTYNDPGLTERMAPTLKRMSGGNAEIIPPITPAEDFAYFQREIPGMYVFLGIAAENDTSPAPNHSPFFRVDERALELGVRIMAALAADYLGEPAEGRR